MHKVIIAQARFGSSRLPGKVLYPLIDRPMLGHVVDRLKAVQAADRVVVAIPDKPADDIVADWCEVLGVDVFRGSEDDVLGRYLQAARHFSADVVIRVCCDAPMLDPAVIDRAIELYLEQRNSVDYLSNVRVRTFPRGQSVEVMNVSVLERMDRLADKPNQREHVTPYLLEHPNQFRVAEFRAERDWSHYNWTVDTADDLEFVRQVYQRLYRPGEMFGMQEILNLLEADPDLASKGELK
jgi:spore coat polysaccharide biosynthesis protein SpsF